MQEGKKCINCGAEVEYIEYDMCEECRDAYLGPEEELQDQETNN